VTGGKDDNTRGKIAQRSTGERHLCSNPHGLRGALSCHLRNHKAK